MIPMYIR